MGNLRVLSGYVLCVDNSGYPASLETLKLYRTGKTHSQESSRGLLRVFDESGRAYLFPETCFAQVTISLKKPFTIKNRRVRELLAA